MSQHTLLRQCLVSFRAITMWFVLHLKQNLTSGLQRLSQDTVIIVHVHPSKLNAGDAEQVKLWKQSV